MARTLILRGIFLAAALLLTSSALIAAERPNIVMIIPDDMGWNDIGYHNKQIITPNLDRLASGGVRIQQHYVYPTCSPTRAGVISGRNPSRFKIHSPIGGKSKHHLPTDILTLPKALKNAGYSTHISGKWHLGLQTKYGPLKYGFDSSYGYLHGQIDVYNHLYKFDDLTWHRNDVLLEEEGHATDLITDEAVRVIRRKQEKPFFLYVTYEVPHYPLKEPKKWLDAYQGKIADPWRLLFAASITHMDAGVGRIIAALEETGQRENTLVVFISDNGGQKDWKAPAREYQGRYEPHTTLGDNHPLRGWKGDLYEGGIRVPAFANWPGHLTPGKQVDAATSFLDWLPTFCSLAGIEPPAEANIEGMNIWPLIEGDGLESLKKGREFYWNTGRELAVRRGPWKLITKRTGNVVGLFNLGEDPLEKENLAKENPRRVEELKKLLAEQLRIDG